MKTIEIILWCCVALLPSLIHGVPPRTFHEQPKFSDILKEALNNMAENNGTINDILKPSIDGYLGEGGYAVLYKGTLLYPTTDRREVAMKITPFDKRVYAEKEYEMYSYLHAIDDPAVEYNGIPSVYYYGTWENNVLMAITLLDLGFSETHRDHEINTLDALILCRAFVRITKYIHSCGIWHRDIKLANLMFRRNNGFVIDFNRARKMYNTSTVDWSSRRAARECANDDWKLFIWTTCRCLNIEIKKFHFDDDHAHNILKQFKRIEYKDLGRVFFEMSGHIAGIKTPSSSNDVTSSYDRIYKIIEEEIEKYPGETPKMVHWLEDDDKSVAKQEFITIPPISSIKDPQTMVEINYPDPKFEYFREKFTKLKRKNIRSKETGKSY